MSKTKKTNKKDRISVGDHVSIYQRGKRKTWTADYHYIDQNGQRKHGRRSLGTRVRRTAEMKALALERQLANGELKSKPAPAAPVLIRSGITQFIDSKRTDGRSRKTLVKYQGELENFATFAEEKKGIRQMDQLTLSLFDDYKSHRKNIDKRDDYTIYNHLIIHKTWLKWCRRRDLISKDPLMDVEISEPRRRRHPAATLEQVNAILLRAIGTSLAVLATCAFSGLRIGEAMALRPQDVDLDEGIIHIRRRRDWDPKTEGSERDVPIHPRLLAIVKAKPKGKGGWFFNAPPSNQFPEGDHSLNPREVNEEFQALAVTCGFTVGRDDRGLTLHSLRRFFKTVCLDAGAPKPMVDAWMGHQDQSDMDTFYYNPQKSKEWMARMPFGAESSEAQRVQMTPDTKSK